MKWNVFNKVSFYVFYNVKIIFYIFILFPPKEIYDVDVDIYWEIAISQIK